VPLHPVTAYGKSKAEAEKVCSEYFREIPITIIRPPPVYGPRDKETIVLFRFIAKGFALILNPKTRISIAYIRNLTEGIFQAAISPKSAGEVYYLSDDDIISWEDFADHIAEALDKKPIRLRPPKFVLKAFGGLSDFWCSITKKPSILNKDKIAMALQENLTVSNKKAKRDFGFTQLIPLEQGLAATVSWYKENGWL
jgi:nucleoside-diphosphate-sugar epimerase